MRFPSTQSHQPDDPVVPVASASGVNSSFSVCNWRAQSRFPWHASFIVPHVYYIVNCGCAASAIRGVLRSRDMWPCIRFPRFCLQSAGATSVLVTGKFVAGYGVLFHYETQGGLLHPQSAASFPVTRELVANSRVLYCILERDFAPSVICDRFPCLMVCSPRWFSLIFDIVAVASPKIADPLVFHQLSFHFG